MESLFDSVPNLLDSASYGLTDVLESLLDFAKNLLDVACSLFALAFSLKLVIFRNNAHDLLGFTDGLMDLAFDLVGGTVSTEVVDDFSGFGAVIASHAQWDTTTTTHVP